MTQIKNIKPGETVMYKGLEVVILEHEEGAILVIAKDSIGSMRFGEDNNWDNSFIKKYFNAEFLGTLDEEDMLETVIGKISLLSVGEYKKFKELIPVINKIWWLRSPGLNNSYAAGAYGYNDIYYFNVLSFNAIRPAFYLKPDTIVTCKAEEKQEMSAREYLTKLKDICKKEKECIKCPLYDFECPNHTHDHLNDIDAIIEAVENYELKSPCCDEFDPEIINKHNYKYCPWCGVVV